MLYVLYTALAVVVIGAIVSFWWLHRFERRFKQADDAPSRGVGDAPTCEQLGKRVRPL